MTHRAYTRHGSEPDLRRYKRFDSGPTSSAHKGFCPCGVETSRNVTVGAPGHPRNGWECRECGERYLREQFDRAMRKP